MVRVSSHNQPQEGLGIKNSSAAAAWELLSVIASLLVLHATAIAQVDPGTKCQADRLKAAGKLVKQQLRCHATAAKKGGVVDPSCLSDAEGKFADAIVGADSEGGCRTTINAAAIATSAGSFGGDVLGELWSTPTASACTAAKLKATGKRAAQTFVALASEKRKPNAVKLVERISRTTTTFAEAFANAEEKPESACQTIGDAEDIAWRVDAFVTATASQLAGGVVDCNASTSEELNAVSAGETVLNDALSLLAAGGFSSSLSFLEPTFRTLRTSFGGDFLELCDSA